MSDFDDFMEITDEKLTQALGVYRDPSKPDQSDAAIAMVAGTEEGFDTGLTIIAVGTVGCDIDSVEVTLHGFRDGKRVILNPISLGDELIVSLRNG